MECVYPITLESPQTLRGIPGYKYGSENDFALSVNEGGTICISYINASFTFQQGKFRLTIFFINIKSRLKFLLFCRHLDQRQATQLSNFSQTNILLSILI
jgi:hypothetical protein